MKLAVSTRDGTVDVAWLMRALEHARSQGQGRVLDYLEAIADDVVFEMESAARRRPVAHEKLEMKSQHRVALIDAPTAPTGFVQKLY